MAQVRRSEPGSWGCRFFLGIGELAERDLSKWRGAASTTFTVQQAGFCGYSLSVNAISIPPGGGSATINVSTGTGCAWSVVTSAVWLTVSNGGGTGAGSFTVSAAANTGSTDLLAVITVMGQTLTVIEGNPVGTSSSGSITISGNPNFKIVCTCNGCDDPCTKEIVEAGTIWVNIGGDVYSVAYGGTLRQSSSQLATTLASTINTGSLVSATVSGSTITLVSEIKGALTNYSLGTWYSYDYQDFSSPAFTATLSGPTMTGGTD